MERDIDKIISLKINTAEMTPSYWQKDQVWLRIQSTLNRRPSMKLRYAATLILLTCCATVYFFYRWEQTRVQLKLAALEEAVHQSEKRTSKLNKEEAIDNCIPGSSTVVLPLTTKRSKEEVFLNVIDTPMVAAVPEERVEITTAPLADVTASIEQSDTVVHPVINAIIGVIPTIHPGVRTAKARKIKFKLPRDNEFSDEGTNAEYAHVITARIN
ncbi:MAG: hypothetical protein JST46_15620 [Bacteroidetes bacterium]|nr:hypothetical protein [Bacteroidota bacterium]